MNIDFKIEFHVDLLKSYLNLVIKIEFQVFLLLRLIISAYLWGVYWVVPLWYNKSGQALVLFNEKILMPRL